MPERSEPSIHPKRGDKRPWIGVQMSAQEAWAVIHVLQEGIEGLITTGARDDEQLAEAAARVQNYIRAELREIGSEWTEVRDGWA